MDPGRLALPAGQISKTHTHYYTKSSKTGLLSRGDSPVRLHAVLGSISRVYGYHAFSQASTSFSARNTGVGVASDRRPGVRLQRLQDLPGARLDHRRAHRAGLWAHCASTTRSTPVGPRKPL